MEYGAHLPLIGFDGKPHTLKRLLDYTEAAERLGFQTICANDHLVFPRPWFEGPTALASVLTRAGQMTLATTVSLPVVRGPVALAKTLGAIDLLSEGRLVVGVGPGSSARDYATVGIPFEERWKRLDEAVRTLRALWAMDTTFQGRFYSSEGIELEPPPAQKGGPPIWIGSWGSAAGFAERYAWATDGWPPPTTPRRRSSVTPGSGSNRPLASLARTRIRSPTPWRPCSYTSPKTGLRRTESSVRLSSPQSTVLRRSCGSAC